jgi:hypothetical protein
MLVAIINNNLVESVQELNEEQYSQKSSQNQLLIDITGIYPSPQVGWSFNGSTLVSNGETTWLITKLAMRNRFTLNELIAFYNLTQVSIPYKIMLDNLAVSTFIDLKRPDTYAGIMALVAAGVLTSERASAILNTEPTSVEAYRGV